MPVTVASLETQIAKVLPKLCLWMKRISLYQHASLPLIIQGLMVCTETLTNMPLLLYVKHI